LFRYIGADYIRGYEKARKSALCLEALSDTITINSMYGEKNSSDD
jgi:hypothetical protein